MDATGNCRAGTHIASITHARCSMPKCPFWHVYGHMQYSMIIVVFLWINGKACSKTQFLTGWGECQGWCICDCIPFLTMACTLLCLTPDNFTCQYTKKFRDWMAQKIYQVRKIARRFPKQCAKYYNRVEPNEELCSVHKYAKLQKLCMSHVKTWVRTVWCGYMFCHFLYL